MLYYQSIIFETLHILYQSSFFPTSKQANFQHISMTQCLKTLSWFCTTVNNFRTNKLFLCLMNWTLIFGTLKSIVLTILLIVAFLLFWFPTTSDFFCLCNTVNVCKLFRFLIFFNFKYLIFSFFGPIVWDHPWKTFHQTGFFALKFKISLPFMDFECAKEQLSIGFHFPFQI